MFALFRFLLLPTSSPCTDIDIHVYSSEFQPWFKAQKQKLQKLKDEFGEDYSLEIDIKRKHSNFWGEKKPFKGLLVYSFRIVD